MKLPWMQHQATPSLPSLVFRRFQRDCTADDLVERAGKCTRGRRGFLAQQDFNKQSLNTNLDLPRIDKRQLIL